MYNGILDLVRTPGDVDNPLQRHGRTELHIWPTLQMLSGMCIKTTNEEKLNLSSCIHLRKKLEYKIVRGELRRALLFGQSILTG